MLPHDRQNCHGHAGRTISAEGGRHLLSLLSSHSIAFYVNRDPLNVSPPMKSRKMRDIPTITARPSLLSASQSSPHQSRGGVISLHHEEATRVSAFHTVKSHG
jgi:hypothetical protein